MLFTRASLLGLALLAGGTASSFAADLGSLRGDEEDRTANAGAARFYLRGDLGYDWNRAPSLDENGTGFDSSSISNTWNYGGGLGWYLSPNWRMDVTAEHHNDAKVSGAVTSTAFTGTEEFNVSSTVVLANLYYDFTGRAGFNPYLGAGIGWAHNYAHGGIATDLCGCVTTIDSGAQDNFAWDVTAGVTRELDRGFSLDLNYRLLDMGGAHTGNLVNKLGHAITNTDPTASAIYSNEIRVGVRYDIQ